MQSANNNSRRGLLSFPLAAKPNVAAATGDDKATAQAHFATIHELCRDTAMALQELRDGIANVQLDTVEELDVDARTLTELLDERPSVVRDLLDGDTDGLTTETLIEHLQRLHEHSER